jgi:poly(3-hydroxybutyrate) depolymerase
MVSIRNILVVLFIIGFSSTVQSVKLEKYNVDVSKVTVSGISSGAAMATNFHFIHSSEVSGAGIVAGVPFGCGIGVGAEGVCMKTPSLVNINYLITQANGLASNGDIDPTSNIAGNKVFIFHGSKDTMVLPPSGPNVEQFYRNYGAQISTDFSVAAEHGFPTNHHGAECGSKSDNDAYLNNCGYKGAFKILDHLYGPGLNEPSGNEGILTNLLEYEQSEFFVVAPIYSSMDTTGFIYVPTACREGALCKLHIAFHGCMQSRGEVQKQFATNAGFMETAELNNVIVLFPQSAATPANTLS